MVRYVNEGNIFTIDGIKCYAHGCNCAGAGYRKYRENNINNNSMMVLLSFTSLTNTFIQ